MLDDDINLIKSNPLQAWIVANDLCGRPDCVLDLEIAGVVARYAMPLKTHSKQPLYSQADDACTKVLRLVGRRLRIDHDGTHSRFASVDQQAVAAIANLMRTTWPDL